MAKLISNRILAQAALLYSAAIWGSTFFVVKDALAFVDPVVLVGYRFTLAGLILAGWLYYSKKNLLLNIHHGLFLGVILWILYIAQTVGLKYTTASNSGFITGLFIVFVPLVNWLFYRRQAKIQHLVAVVIALIGLWLLTGGINGINTGDILTLAAAVTYAIHVIYAGRCMEDKVDPWVLNCQQMLVVGILALITAFFWGIGDAFSGSMSLTTGLSSKFMITGWAGVWAILFLTVFPTLTAYAAQLYGQQRVDEVRTSLIFTMEPVFAAIFAWTLGGETFLVFSAIGGSLMVIAMVVSELPIARIKQGKATS